MEIDQITSLVSIFSFGQHIIAAGSKDSVSADKTGSADKPAEDKKASEDDSDSESDTSSDSGHSSDDHDTSSDKEAKEEESGTVLTKLKRSVSTPDLCSASAAAPGRSSDAPLCVEVASV
jgi:hypothetical protein